MPVYEFECEACGKVTSPIMSFEESKKEQYCEDCGWLLHKLVSTSTFFKGDGYWADK